MCYSCITQWIGKASNIVAIVVVAFTVVINQVVVVIVVVVLTVVINQVVVVIVVTMHAIN